MKRVLLTFMAAAATVAATAQDIYKTDFSTEEEFQKWTVIDANGDNATWKFDAEGSQSHVYYPYSATNQADDWQVTRFLWGNGRRNQPVVSLVRSRIRVINV